MGSKTFKKLRLLEILANTFQRPRMYAQSVEPMLMRIVTLIEVAVPGFSSSDFYIKHSGKDGSCYAFKIPDSMDFDEWTRSVIDDALVIIKASAK